MSLHDFCEKTEQYVVDIIYGRHVNTFDTMFRHFLFILSRLYRNITQLRLTLYDNSLIKQHELGCTVISFGNLTTGGTGKTPVVCADPDQVIQNFACTMHMFILLSARKTGIQN